MNDYFVEESNFMGWGGGGINFHLLFPIWMTYLAPLHLSQFSMWQNSMSIPNICFRLLLGSCGTYQYRLQGPNAWSGAKTAVMKVPVPEMYQYTGIAVVVFLAIWLLYIFSFVFWLFNTSFNCLQNLWLHCLIVI